AEQSAAKQALEAAQAVAQAMRKARRKAGPTTDVAQTPDAAQGADPAPATVEPNGEGRTESAETEPAGS
ncbi:MAG TPA: hypothetical protein VH278_10870, partial [Burkholderiaceae bacterium]|nr:hypothetical protein [Burkholderiaceae bacterium]